jgi:tetratricopeptide (TPR) repeat protein
MKRALVFCLLVAAGAVACAQGRPLVLIYQVRQATFNEVDPNLIVDAALANALAEVGKVTPVVWSESDRVIAEARRTGRLRGLPKNPNPGEVLRVAEVLSARYVAIVTVTHVGGLLEGTIDLYRDGRRLWSEIANTAIVRDGEIDKQSTILSVAQTWASKMNIGPFRDLVGTPDEVMPGPALVRLHPTQDPPAGSFELGMAALEAGRLVDAIVHLRDAVDSEPFDPVRRKALVEALRLAGHPYLAAEEGERAAELMPEEASLISAAAAAWLSGGQVERAYNLVRRILDKDERNAPALCVLADLHVARLEFSAALEALDKALAVRADGETYFRRSQVHALNEDFAAAARDMSRAAEVGLSQEPPERLRRYRQLASVLDQVFESLALRTRNLLREARTTPTESSVGNRALQLVNSVRSFQTYLDQADVPDPHERSHAERALAVNLLLQSALGIQRYVQDRSPETAADADLLQVEAMREHAVAKQLFGTEVGR